MYNVDWKRGQFHISTFFPRIESLTLYVETANKLRQSCHFICFICIPWAVGLMALPVATFLWRLNSSYRSLIAPLSPLTFLFLLFSFFICLACIHRRPIVFSFWLLCLNLPPFAPSILCSFVTFVVAFEFALVIFLCFLIVLVCFMCCVGFLLVCGVAFISYEQGSCVPWNLFGTGQMVLVPKKEELV